MTSTRVYVYGVDFDGSREFLATELDLRGAEKYCEKFTRFFPDRFDYLIYGTIVEIQDDEYRVYC